MQHPEMLRRAGDSLLILGHRGASAHAPENTLAAYRRAATDGADGVELDVRRSADGTLVVHHDPGLPDGRVIADTELTALPAWLPTLSAAVAAVDGLVNVEAKDLPHEPGHDPESPVAVAAARSLIDMGATDRCWVSSFDPRAVEAVRAQVPSVATALLLLHVADPVEAAEAAASAGHRALHPHESGVDAGFVAAAHDAGLAVHVWTVDDPRRLAELDRLGVDGVITNDPGATRRHLTARPERDRRPGAWG